MADGTRRRMVWTAELFFNGSEATAVFRGERNAAPAPEDGYAIRPQVRETTMHGSEGPQFLDALLGLVVTIKRVLEGFDGLL